MAGHTRAADVPHRRPLRLPRAALRATGDERLVDRVRDGDEVAFEVLYERHIGAVLGYCRHMLGSQEEAEDVVQQAFVAAHGAMLRDERDIHFKPWLFKIARNRAISAIRERTDTASLEREPVAIDGLDQQVAQRADLRELLEDIRELPDEQREALLLFELGGMPQAEIAKVLEREPVDVRGLVHRAREGLLERRAARTTDCVQIREELAVATGGTFRRTDLRAHLKHCDGCSAYLAEIRSQRRMLGLALPVIPALALRGSVLGAVGGGSATTIGGAAGVFTGTVAKVAIAGALISGTAVGAHQVATTDDGSSPANAPGNTPGATEPGGAGAAGGAAIGERVAREKSERAKKAKRKREEALRKAAGDRTGSGAGTAEGNGRGQGAARRNSKAGTQGRALGKTKNATRGKRVRRRPSRQRRVVPKAPTRVKPVKPVQPTKPITPTPPAPLPQGKVTPVVPDATAGTPTD